MYMTIAGIHIAGIHIAGIHIAGIHLFVGKHLIVLVHTRCQQLQIFCTCAHNILHCNWKLEKMPLITHATLWSALKTNFELACYYAMHGHTMRVVLRVKHSVSGCYS